MDDSANCAGRSEIMVVMPETMSDFESHVTMSRPNHMKFKSNTNLLDKALHTIVLVLLTSLLSWGTTGAAQTSENAQDLTLDTPGNATDNAITTATTATTAAIADQQNTTDDAGEKLPNGSDADTPIAETTTPNTEPAQVQAPSGQSGRVTTAIERFTPTEEISADNAVPFPVDI
jgi:cytoskeletal protein RodZ